MFTLLSVPARKLCMPSVLRANGMDDVLLQRIFRSVVIVKLMYAFSAWWGFAGASDRQRLAAFIRRSDRSRFVPANLPAFADLCHDADEKKCLLPSSATVITYYITSCRHSPLVHKTTTCGSVHTILPSLLDLVISLTITLSNACYISTYTRILTLYFNSLTLLCLYFSYVHVLRFVSRILNQD